MELSTHEQAGIAIIIAGDKVKAIENKNENYSLKEKKIRTQKLSVKCIRENYHQEFIKITNKAQLGKQDGNNSKRIKRRLQRNHAD